MEIKPILSYFLDFARWTSAMLVVIGHLRSIMFVNYDSVTQPNILIRVFYLISGFGHEAVMIFFVLSGFLVGGKVFYGVRNGAFKWNVYFVHRFSRLYVVLFFALILGFLLDWTGSHYLNQSGIYDNSDIFISSVNYSIIDRISITNFLGNLLMLQTILTPTFGSNGPLWSLANEFWYYVLFPLILLLFARTDRIFDRAIFIILILLVALLLSQNGGQILLYFPIWLLGVIIALIRRPLFKIPIIPVTLLLASLITSRMRLLRLETGLIEGLGYDFLIAIAFGLLLNTVSFSQAKPVFYPSLNKRLANFSYSLYAVHFPVMIFLVALVHAIWGTGLSLQPNSVVAWVIFGVLLASLYIISYFFSQLGENNTPQFRRILFFFLEQVKKRGVTARGSI